MPTPLEIAISDLEKALGSLGLGTPRQPTEGTRDWYLLRAYGAGLSSLKALQVSGLESDHAGAERAYRRILGENKQEMAAEAPGRQK